MISRKTFKVVLEKFGFSKQNTLYKKHYKEFDCYIEVDFKNEKLIYPEEKGLIVNDKTTSNFSSPENFVVFEAVCRLLAQGYNPAHIELEKRWQLGHTQKSGKADIVVKDNDGKILLIIECKTAGSEYKKAIKILENDERNQLFSYLQQAPTTKFLALYSSDFVDGRVVFEYYLINVVDNKELLENEPELKGYKDAPTTEEKWRVWRETYGGEYATIGLFENNQAYQIGKSKFSINDLKPISSKDIQGKYNQFATILRKHNVSGRENAFDRLVNLFLCKVVDEIQNKEDLKFYYKGKAYDNPFDFQDRLLQLYRDGMKEFLNEDITYIDNEKIESVFSHYDIETIKRDIKELLKQQKFFTNNDFTFIDVHNKELFEKNFQILLEVVNLIQNISLTGSENNQFLGDMFENFLDQGVKQSEGQFFTPMPIVKFIIRSLPNKQTPNVIDYACGAGHFLNEYYLLNQDSNIVGIEKEYRLSKVAKVSSFMYGSKTKIIYTDALKQISEVKEGSFDILIANPPYSVKGFLETLEAKDKEQFELSKTIDEKSFATNNTIECFFLERAKQLLVKDGYAGIIVPSSILNKGDGKNTYVVTREILLKYFEIVAIAEFGSGTFGKTGTNTVVLFLKRLDDTKAKHKVYKELANRVFECDLDFDKYLKEKELLEKYCNYIEIDVSVYKKFLCGEVDEILLKHDTFKEYEAKYKAKNIKESFVSFIKKIEKQKFYYFCLAYTQANNVVIVKSPSKNSEMKKFLGYEWSSRKGSEGIHYIGESLDNIQTPLYKPKNYEDTTKINKIIKDNFEGKNIVIPDELKQYVNTARLVDMLDFSRVEFNKALNLSPTKKVAIKSKWRLVRLGEVVDDIIAGQSPKSEFYNEDKQGLPFYQGKKDFGKKYLKEASMYVSKPLKISKKSDILISVRAPVGDVNYNPYKKICIGRGLGAIRIEDNILRNYIFNFIQENKNIFQKRQGNSFEAITIPDLKNTKIPLPPIEIQEKIVQECEKIDKISEALRIENEKLKEKISYLITDTQGKVYKLGDVCNLKAGKFMSASEISSTYEDGLYPCYGGNGLRGYVKSFTHEGVYSLIGRQGALCGNVTFVSGKFHATEHAVVVTPKIELDSKWLYHKLVIMNLNQYKTGVAQPGLSVKNLNAVNIDIPSLQTQKVIVKKIENLETKITQNQKIIDENRVKKEEVLRKYL